MWILKVKIKHDCTIASRCEKFGLISHSLALSNWKKKGYDFTSQRHTLEGDEKSISKFFDELKKDKRITNLEIDKNTVFFIEKRKDTIPSSHYHPKMFYVKPVYVNKKGYEFWEMGSWERKQLEIFLNSLKKEKGLDVELLSFRNTKLNNIYFPAIAPNLTEKQKRAFELAVEEGYYDIPKRTELKKLSKMMKISLATYQEHLKRAEAKVVPKLKIC